MVKILMVLAQMVSEINYYILVKKYYLSAVWHIFPFNFNECTLVMLLVLLMKYSNNDIIKF